MSGFPGTGRSGWNFGGEAGEKRLEVFREDMSELIQHEIDHLFGIVATDRLEDSKDIMMREEWEKNFGDR